VRLAYDGAGKGFEMYKWMGLYLLAILTLSACAGSSFAGEVVDTPTPHADTPTIEATPLPGNLDQVTFTEDDQTYVIRQLLPRDGIMPIYDPQFTDAETAGYDPEELVMGVEINGDARAYPVGTLRSREMVNDIVGDIPVLVTW
jgi:hypothetical protein